MEHFSRFVSHTLDYIGYSKEVVRLRRSFWRDWTRLDEELTLHNLINYDGLRRITAGSKGEGITSLFESDIDFMCLCNDVICSDNVAPLLHVPGMTIFQMDVMSTAPGYSKLKLIKDNGRIRSETQESLFKEEAGDIYASSTLFAAECNRVGRLQPPAGGTVLDLSGPSFPLSYGGLIFDNVIAFRCISIDVLGPFRARHRHHDWPPEDLIRDVSCGFCQLVPVGCKGSADQWKEWRFCFIETELKLTCSLNSTQLKLYVLLKMVAKNILKHVSNEVSSYIMKNITFWMCELLGTRVFREENLISLLLLALRFLRHSIDTNCLPYFMISARNLLAERFTPQTRHRLSVLILQLLEEGPLALHRCHKLHIGMTVMQESQALLFQYRNLKENTELLLLSYLYISELKRNGLHDGQVLKELSKKNLDILFPERRLYFYLGFDCSVIFKERLRSILS